MRRQTQRSCNSLRISNFLSTCSRLLFRSWVFRTIFVSASQVLSLDLTKEILASLKLLDNFPLGRCCCVSLVLLLLFVIQTRTDLLLVLSFYLFFDLDSGQPPQWFYYKNVKDCSYKYFSNYCNWESTQQKKYFQGIKKGLKLLDCQPRLPGLDRVQPGLLMTLRQLLFAMPFSPC